MAGLGAPGMDYIPFNKVANADIYGASINVLGSHMHNYSATGFEDCIAMCAHTSDCFGVVNHPGDQLCYFKRKDGRVFEGDDLIDNPFAGEKSDAYIRTEPPKDAPSPQPLPTPIALSSEANRRIYSVPNFVSPFEAKKLRKFAQNCFARAKRRGGSMGDGDTQQSLGAMHCLAKSSGVLLARIEERIARLTGLAAHAEEEPMMFSRALSRHISTSQADGRSFTNLHHDKNKQERRVATVIIYLTTQEEDGQGGHTLFPAITPVGWDKEMPHRRGATARALRGAFKTGKRALGCKQSAEDPDQSDPGCGDWDGVATHTALECERALNGTAHGIALRPTLGTALYFWSELEDQEPDPIMWHAACYPKSFGQKSPGRWILQKFKSRPKPPGANGYGERCDAKGNCEKIEL